MAGRTFRQTRLDTARIENGIGSVENTDGNVASDVDETIDGQVRSNGNEDGFIAEETITDGLPIEPTSINEPEQPIRRRRGRQKGSVNREKRGSLAQTTNLEKLMLSLHLMAATFLKVPELRIDEQEAAILTKATKDVLKAYGVPELTEKQVAVGQAAMAIASVYGTRAVVIMARKTNKAKPNLVQFPAAPAAPFAPAPPTPSVAEVLQQSPVNIVGAAPDKANPAQNQGFVSSSSFAVDADSLEAIGAS